MKVPAVEMVTCGSVSRNAMTVILILPTAVTSCERANVVMVSFRWVWKTAMMVMTSTMMIASPHVDSPNVAMAQSTRV